MRAANCDSDFADYGAFIAGQDMVSREMFAPRILSPYRPPTRDCGINQSAGASAGSTARSYFIAVSVPVWSCPPLEQFGIARCRTERFDQRVERVRLRRVFARRRMQQGRLAG